MKPGMKVAIVFAVGLLAVGTLGIQSYRGIRQLTEANRWVVHTHEVLKSLDHVLSELKDAETGQRGFILFGEERYLKPYQAAAAEIQQDLDAAAELTRDNPEQQLDLAQLRKLVRAKLDELQETIALRREGGMAAALPVMRSDRGRQIMDDIRALVDRMLARERQLLETRDLAARQVARQSVRAVVIGMLLALLVLGAAAVIVTLTMQYAERRAPPPGGRRNWAGIAARYAFAAAVVGLATGLRIWLERTFGPMPLFITWYPAVLLVATLAGGGPGVAATVLSTTVATYWFIEPIGSFAIHRANDAIAVGFFAGTGLFLSILAERLRRARWAEAVSATQEQELALLNMGNVMALDLDHRILRWSEGNHRLYGFDAQEARGQRTYALLQTHFDLPLEQIHAELLEKDHWEGDVTRRSKDGTPLSLSLLWAVRRDARGQPLAILEVSTDITRQKHAEETLRQQAEELSGQNEELSQQAEELSGQNEELQTQAEDIQTLNAELGHREQMLQTLLDAARLPLGEQDVLSKVCRAAMEMIGPAAAGAVVCERQGDALQVLAHAGFEGGAVPASWAAGGSFVELVMREDRTASIEDARLRPDLNLLTVPGQARFAAVLAAPLHADHASTGAVSIYSATPQAWTEEQFRTIEWLAAQVSNTLRAMRLAAGLRQGQEQNAFLASILEASSQAFGVGYPDGRLGLINAAFEQLTGYSGAELRSIDWARTLTPPEWLGSERAKLEELQRTGLPVRYEKEYIRKDGARVPIELLVHLVKDAAGKPLYYYSFLTDITKRKRAEESLRRTADDLLRSNRDLEQFAHVVSHDLKEPLRMVTAFTGLLKENYAGQLDARASEYIGHAADAATRMQVLVDDLLAYARVGRNEAIEAVDVNGAVERALANLQMSVAESGARITRDALPTVPANAVDLAQLFQNLIGNALKFRDPKRPTEVRIGARKVEGEAFWLFTVRDNGIGIEPQYTERIFKIFQRLHARDEYPGTGIGLAICKKVVERRGGRIWVESEPGKGSTFCFTLPE